MPTRMQLDRSERAMLDSLAEGSDSIISRAVDWCSVNSGSRNFVGLERQRALLADAFAALPGAVTSEPLAPSQDVDASGRDQETSHPLAVEDQEEW